ncbi:hypothetical protein [Microbacterium sp. RU33B]|uniref:hypothetical protein n=1 Tax=Microbacterium sp. RU33B TaxID=1907390 RepID=UPI00095974A9|nr:hypothetical protein [Microbacterium sp. RU33B]SIT73608.1 hypothetical protein SAMN05880545_1246 [Microbacterium sp. RU33B]
MTTDTTITDPPAPITWESLTAAADPGERARLNEVHERLRPLYVQARAIVERALAADSERAIMKYHFRRWADSVAGATTQSDTQRAALRAHIADPERYPGGVAGLRADTAHVRALEEMQGLAAKAREAAEQALNDARAVQSAAERTHVTFCKLCRSRYAEEARLRQTSTGYVELDALSTCAGCAAHAQETLASWNPLAEQAGW